MQKILLVSGTRPEVIKLAPLYHALREQAWAAPFWLHTAERGAARQVFGIFGLQPDVTLDPHTLTRKFSLDCRRQLEARMHSEPWSAVVVQGDSESAFLGALAAYYHQIPVAHVEAGLRTYNLGRPLISRLGRFHFAPNERARDLLLAEGVLPEHIHLTGDTVVDAQQWVTQRYGIRRQTSGRGHLLVSIHRGENKGPALAEICLAIGDIAQQKAGLDVLVHCELPARERRTLAGMLGRMAHVKLAPPPDYLGTQQSLADAWAVLTDSTGLREEAPHYGVPVLTLRSDADRHEAADGPDNGGAVNVSPRRADIARAVLELLQDPERHARLKEQRNPFGEGGAAMRMAGILEQHLGAVESDRPARREWSDSAAHHEEPAPQPHLRDATEFPSPPREAALRRTRGAAVAR